MTCADITRSHRRTKRANTERLRTHTRWAKNSAFPHEMRGEQLVLPVYEPRYYFIVCVEIDNVPDITIYLSRSDPRSDFGRFPSYLHDAII